MSPEWRWLWPYIAVDFLNRFAHGIFGTMMGPAQPYLARKNGVDIATVNFLMTAGSFAGLISAFITANNFRRRFTTQRSKMAFMSVCGFCMTITTFLFPIVSSFPLLVTMFTIRNFMAMAWETAGGSLLVYTVGPIVSRPLVMAYHFVVAIGFAIGPSVIRRFLPEDDGAGMQDVCVETDHQLTVDDDNAMDRLKWPFFMVALLQLMCAIGYLAVACLPYPMPVYDDGKGEPSKGGGRKQRLTRTQDLFVMFCVVVFYAASCGSERIFQSFEFTFGMCGPLKLSPDDAVKTDSFYNSGFMIGRFLSMFVVKIFPPRFMLKISLCVCLVSSAFITWQGGTSAYLLYWCAAFFGCCVSWQFGSAYSWIAEHLDVVGPKASLFIFGCSLGGMITPPVAGFLFKDVAPMGVWYLNITCVLVQVLFFLTLTIMFRQSDEGLVKYNRVEQEDRIRILSDSEEEEEI